MCAGLYPGSQITKLKGRRSVKLGRGKKLEHKTPRVLNAPTDAHGNAHNIQLKKPPKKHLCEGEVKAASAQQGLLLPTSLWHVGFSTSDTTVRKQEMLSERSLHTDPE